MGEFAKGSIGGHGVVFQAAHRDGNDTPAAVQVSMTVPMSYEDIVAALYIVATGGMGLDELADDDMVRRVVVETLLSEDSAFLTSVSVDLEEARSGSAEYALAQALRARVVEVFAPTASRSAKSASRRRALAEVSA
ncbi:hypothetical protein [Saccharopolyspora sp. 6V]|uniref:hypothetical protein n=1 Tax=Saccharopolyspora sp. 6V TaxID=2877239 RepID=UPI001CD4FE70|nr:hypothetical protein [Saccharopolyspora sp. 6V]MCA1194437.1 hypothetical protein [Saccharopolyspora sp. 6V]